MCRGGTLMIRLRRIGLILARLKKGVQQVKIRFK